MVQQGLFYELLFAKQLLRFNEAVWNFLPSARLRPLYTVSFKPSAGKI